MMHHVFDDYGAHAILTDSEAAAWETWKAKQKAENAAFLVNLYNGPIDSDVVAYYTTPAIRRIDGRLLIAFTDYYKNLNVVDGVYEMRQLEE